jgi:CheY-like chemotaxis protein
MVAKTVLLVDDSRVARMMTRKIIDSAHPDWTVIEAASGEEAIEKVAAGAFDFVILDVNMPGMGGLEAARHLRGTGTKAIITLLTANIQEPVRLQAEAIGIGFLNKPVREDLLLAFLAGAAS